MEPSSNNFVPTAKVVLLGDSGTGKTSLALRFAKNEFHPYTESTIGASFLTKIMPLHPVTSQNDTSDHKEESKTKLFNYKKKTPTPPPSSSMIQFNIWDTAGQEKYHALTPMYYRGADAAILVYDICSEVAFQSLQRWVQELTSRGPADLVIIVCGNKCDLKDKRRVGKEMGEGYALSIGALYMETSARDDINVDGMFRELGHILRGKLKLRGDPITEMLEDDHGGDIIDLRTTRERQLTCCS